MPVFHTKTIESILEPVAQQVSVVWLFLLVFRGFLFFNTCDPLRPFPLSQQSKNIVSSVVSYHPHTRISVQKAHMCDVMPCGNVRLTREKHRANFSRARDYFRILLSWVRGFSRDNVNCQHFPRCFSSDRDYRDSSLISGISIILSRSSPHSSQITD